MANCNTSEVKMITFTIYDAPMARGNVIYDFIEPEETPEKFLWEYYDPKESLYGEMLEEICKIR